MLKSYERSLIRMLATIRRSISSCPLEMVNSKNLSHITNYLISFPKRNRLPIMDRPTYSDSIIFLIIRAPSNIMTHTIKVLRGMFMSTRMMVQQLGSRRMKLTSLTLSQWLCMPMNTAYSTLQDGIFLSGLPSDNSLSMLLLIMSNATLIPSKFTTNLASRFHDLIVKLSNLAVTMATPSGKTLLQSN